MIVLCWCPIE
jgi:predicted transposase YdaD